MKRVVALMLVAILVVLAAPVASAEQGFTFKWTIVGKTHEPARLVRDEGARTIWDDEDWIITVRTCRKFIRCDPYTAHIYYSKTRWDKRSVGDWCRDAVGWSSYVPCKIHWGNGSRRDPLVTHGPLT